LAASKARATLGHRNTIALQNSNCSNNLRSRRVEIASPPTGARRKSVDSTVKFLDSRRASFRPRPVALLVNEDYPSHAVFWAGAQSACGALDAVALPIVASAPAQLCAPGRHMRCGITWSPAGCSHRPRAGRDDRATRRRTGPPLWDLPDAGAGGFDPHAQPAPEYAFDQRIAW